LAETLAPLLNSLCAPPSAPGSNKRFNSKQHNGAANPVQRDTSSHAVSGAGINSNGGVGSTALSPREHAELSEATVTALELARRAPTQAAAAALAAVAVQLCTRALPCWLGRENRPPAAQTAAEPAATASNSTATAARARRECLPLQRAALSCACALLSPLPGGAPDPPLTATDLATAGEALAHCVRRAESSVAVRAAALCALSLWLDAAMPLLFAATSASNYSYSELRAALDAALGACECAQAELAHAAVASKLIAELSKAVVAAAPPAASAAPARAKPLKGAPSCASPQKKELSPPQFVGSGKVTVASRFEEVDDELD